MKYSILHLSHTDIRQDSRIIKELKEIKNEFGKNDVFAIGIKRSSRLKITKLNAFNIKDLSISLATKKIFFIPRIVKYCLNYFEFFFKSIFKIYSKKITIIHCHDFLALPIGYAAKIFFHSKLIYDAHELESERNYIKFKKLIFFLEKLSWKKIDLFITVSPSILKWYHNNLGYKKKSIIVYNAPRITKNKFYKKDYLRKKLKISNDELIFLYVGGFRPGKGIEKKLRSFGVGKFENEIKKFSKKYSNIHIAKPVSHELLTQYIQSADVGLCLNENVSLSRFYSLPNKFFEYAFAGLYILASDFPDMKKLVNSYSLGECISPNYETLIKKIKYLELNKHKTKIKKKDLTQLGWDIQSKTLLNEYKKLFT